MPGASISAIVAVRDGAAYLAEALASIRAQSLPVLELIVVDDGSSDASAALARSFADQVIRQPPTGHASARNRGVRASRGELLAFLDADDLWLPGKLAAQAACLQADATLEAVFGHCLQFYSPELDAAERARVEIRNPLAPAENACAILIRRRAFERIGDFDENRQAAVDLDWTLRARDLGLRRHMLAEVVYHRRVHLNNHGRRFPRQHEERAAALKASLERKRTRP
jgi:glycosyltransferase involved in cell wall biosynthesis